MSDLAERLRRRRESGDLGLRVKTEAVVDVKTENGHAAWDEETQRLAAWAAGMGEPIVPFLIRSGVTVADPYVYWWLLKKDIAAGPAGPRSRYGALQRDLRRLWELFGEGK